MSMITPLPSDIWSTAISGVILTILTQRIAILFSFSHRDIISVTRLGDVQKLLAKNFLFKVAQKFVHFLRKNCCDYDWASFMKNWAIFSLTSGHAGYPPPPLSTYLYFFACFICFHPFFCVAYLLAFRFVHLLKNSLYSRLQSWLQSRELESFLTFRSICNLHSLD